MQLPFKKPYLTLQIGDEIHTIKQKQIVSIIKNDNGFAITFKAKYANFIETIFGEDISSTLGGTYPSMTLTQHWKDHYEIIASTNMTEEAVHVERSTHNTIVLDKPIAYLDDIFHKLLNDKNNTTTIGFRFFEKPTNAIKTNMSDVRQNMRLIKGEIL